MQRVKKSEMEDGWIIKIDAEKPENDLDGKVTFIDRNKITKYIRLIFSENLTIKYDTELIFLDEDKKYKITKEEYMIECL